MRDQESDERFYVRDQDLYTEYHEFDILNEEFYMKGHESDTQSEGFYTQESAFKDLIRFYNEMDDQEISMIGEEETEDVGDKF